MKAAPAFVKKTTQIPGQSEDDSNKPIPINNDRTKKFTGKAKVERKENKPSSTQKLPKSFGGKKNTNEVITNAGLAKIKPTWEDSNSKGSAIFYKMGYRGGGLGKDGSGIEKPIGVRVRPDGLGLGYGDFKEQTADTLIDFDGSLKDKIMDDELIDELNKNDQNNKDIEEELDPNASWNDRKSRISKKKKTIYKTMDEFMKETKKKQVIIDMRDGTEKVYDKNSDTTNLIASKESRIFIELEHNSRKLLELVETEIESSAKKIQFYDDSFQAMKKEKKSLGSEVTFLSERIKKTDQIIDLLEKANNKLMNNSISVESLFTLFKMFKEKFPQEYKQLKISKLIFPMIFPQLEKLLMTWNPFVSQNDKIFFILSQWKMFLLENSISEDSEESSLYYCLINELFLPRFRSIYQNNWKLDNSEKMVECLRLWKTELPTSVFRVFLEQIIVPKVGKELESWNCATNFTDHQFFFFWFDFMPDYLVNLHVPLRFKVCKYFSQTDFIKNTEIINFIKLWNSILINSQQLDFIIKSSILPKLRIYFDEFIINPLKQDLSIFNMIISWHSTIPQQYFVPMFEEKFFPKLYHVIKIWLENQPNYLEIHRWYLGWKTLFPADLLRQPHILASFFQVLEIINAHLNTV